MWRIWGLATVLLLNAQAVTTEQVVKGLQAPPPESRILMRWWWFGPAVTKEELARELEAMKAAGIGGVEIQPVYPLTLDDPANGLRNLRFLSPEFLDALAFASRKGRELGLRVDLTLGSGWPFGGPQIPRELAAKRLRVEPMGRPAQLRWGERLIGEYPEAGLRFIETQTGQMVKRAAVGAEGFVFDHYSREALDRYLETVGHPLLRGMGKFPPFAVFCDSLEVFSADWTSDLPREFQRRRGYDLLPHLPALAGEWNEEKARIRHDWALTLTELAEDRFLKPLWEWSRQQGVKLRAQVYGTPPVSLASQRYVDLADGEQTQWRRLSASRWASSANHILRRPVTASETWTWLHSPTFAANPLDVKAEADIHFIQGINQLIGHGWPYSPPQAGRPGWGFYAAAALNDLNPWWGVMPDLALYLQRASWLLRQGEPVADVLLYLPVADIRSRFSAGSNHVSIDRAAHEAMGDAVIPQILDSGYNFDAVDDGLLEDAFAGGRYRAIVLPRVERIDPQALERIRAFVERGGWAFLIGRRPRLSPGYLNREENDRAVRSAMERLGALGRTVFVEDENRLGEALRAAFAPPVRWEPASPALAYAQRRLEDGDVFFVANTGNRPWRGRLHFRGGPNPAAAWDLMTGEKTAFSGELELPPYGSIVLMSGAGANPAPAPKTRGREMDLSSGWDVTFLETGRKVRYERLRSWTEDAETRYYSGIAAYEKTVHIEPGMTRAWLEFGPAEPLEPVPQRQPGMRAWLAGPVRDAAIVHVNGRRAGSVFAPPYRLDLSGFLKEGENRLRIEVANTNLNLLARLGEPDYRVLAAAYGERFQMQDMRVLQPEPSGLLGWIRLVAWQQPGAGHSDSGSTTTPQGGRNARRSGETR
ncbi:MAG: glycosyl hydrolase [Bryobacteraceae bacterium]|nr:glycosyl hydrolase [Bryobacteraceae bacterium]